jgi:hypothetical protein
MAVVKLLDLLFELNLRCAQGLYLHKLLEIEESFGHRKFITATTAREEGLELGAGW